MQRKPRPDEENEQPNLRRQQSSAQPKLTRLQAKAGKRKLENPKELEDTSDEDLSFEEL
jgi:hypothetical protein